MTSFLISVSVHKIFPKNMTVFKCDRPKCGFVASNKVHFNRHSHKSAVTGVMVLFI